jgi:hypothetical protein
MSYILAVALMASSQAGECHQIRHLANGDVQESWVPDPGNASVSSAAHGGQSAHSSVSVSSSSSSSGSGRQTSSSSSSSDGAGTRVEISRGTSGCIINIYEE